MTFFASRLRARPLPIVGSLVLVASLAATVAATDSASSAAVPGEVKVLLKNDLRERPELDAVLRSGAEAGLTPVLALQRWIDAHSKELAASVGTREEPRGLDDLDGFEVVDLHTRLEDNPADDVADAARWMAQSDDFDSAAATLRKLYPNSFAGLEYQRLGSEKPSRFFLRGAAVPQEALTVVKALPGAVTVEVGNVLPENQLDATFTTIRKSVSEILDEPFLVAYDLGNNEVRIEVPVGTEAIVMDQARERARGLTRGAGIVVVESDDVVLTAQDNVGRGGGYYGTGCTGGFVFRRDSDGDKRLGIAGHCVSSLGSYELYSNHSNDGGSTFVATTYNGLSQASPIDDSGLTDLGVFTPYPSFYYNSGLKRSPTSQEPNFPASGSPTCHFGRATAGSCGTVDYHCSCPFGATGGPTYYVPATRTQGVRNDGGDSGGPYFFGNKAMGTHTAGDPATEVTQFTRVVTYASHGVHVWLP